MAGGVYSKRFLLVSSVGRLDYAVPAGKRAIVKMVSVVNPSSTAQQGVLYIGPTAIWVASVPGNSAASASNLMIVVNAGELLGAAITAATMACVVSGYELDL